VDSLDRPVPDYLEGQAQALRQTAYLIGTFWRAIVDSGAPAHVADLIVQNWFQDDTVEIEGAEQDDD